MIKKIPEQYWIYLFWFVLSGVSIFVRPLFPVDETRYVSVAWEMWLNQDFLVPHLNGQTYSHKPPLLFWLINLLWGIFGVNESLIRWIGPLFSLAGLILTGQIASMLWPKQQAIQTNVQFVLLGFFFWMLYGTLTMFDMMLAFFVLLGIYSIVKLAFSGLTWKRWLLFGIAIGGGILSKGPVILLHLLPVALLAPWWLNTKPENLRWSHWYWGVFSAVLIGATIALCWAIPAGISGGEEYRNAIFFGQTSGRIVNSFAHRLPWWWYLQRLPFLLLPWLFWKPFWQALKHLDLQSPGVRFCLAWLMPVFIAFSLISGKRIHYLLPLMPAFALLLSYGFKQLMPGQQHSRPFLLPFIYLLAGLLLTFLPQLNQQFHIKDEFANLSPFWGLLLVFNAFFLFVKGQHKQKRIFYICTSSVASFLLIESAVFSIVGDHYDMRPAALKIAALQAHHEVAFYTPKYHGQYQFTGRLKKPIRIIKHSKQLREWVNQHPDGVVLKIYDPDKKREAFQQFVHFPFKGKAVVFLPALKAVPAKQ
jgi:4-amino-4-deoxy-L-arabinose transferase-like glycosyltransferase